MLFIFRKIRKSLLAENKTVRYLKYAVGEVLLIMVGILLALQVQNWNEERKDRAEERNILQRLEVEINQHLRGIENRKLMLLARKREALSKVRQAFDSRNIKDNATFLHNVVEANTWSTRTSGYARTTFNELTSSGKLMLVQDTELRSSISSYYTFANGVVVRADLLKSDFSKYVYDLIPLSDYITLMEGLSEDEYAEITKLVLESDIHLEITKEQTRTLAIKVDIENLMDRNKNLLTQIQTELKR